MAPRGEMQRQTYRGGDQPSRDEAAQCVKFTVDQAGDDRQHEVKREPGERGSKNIQYAEQGAHSIALITFVTTGTVVSVVRRFSSGGAAEQALERLDVAAIGEEHDQMVVEFDAGVVMRHDHVLTAHYRDDARALWQRNLLETLAEQRRALGR